MLQNILITLRENKTLQEMLAGIGAAGILAVILCLIFSKDPLYLITGLLAGILGAAFMAVHMAYTIEDAVMLSEKDAAAYSRKMTFIRYGIACILVVGIGVSDIGHPVMTVIGLLLLKAGAYMQPLVHIILHGKDLNDFTEEENQVIIGKIQSNLDPDSDNDSDDINQITQGGE